MNTAEVITVWIIILQKKINYIYLKVLFSRLLTVSNFVKSKISINLHVYYLCIYGWNAQNISVFTYSGWSQPPCIHLSLTNLLCVPMRLLLCKLPSLDLFIGKMEIIVWNLWRSNKIIFALTIKIPSHFLDYKKYNINNFSYIILLINY